MPPARSSTPLVLACLLALTAALLGGLMLGVAGDRKGMHALPREGSTVDVLPDVVAGFTFDEVRGKPEEAWARWDGRGYIQSFFGEAAWVRITLRNPGPEPLRGVLADAEYYTDHIDLWLREADGAGWAHHRAGERVPAAERPLPGRDAAFPIEVPAGGERVAILRLQDHFGVWLRPVWWPDERAFLAAQARDAIAEAAYFGILLALLVYNGFVWVRLKFRDIGWYLGYLGSAAGFMFLSRAQHQAVGWSVGSPLIEMPVTVALAASGFFLTQFARAFLELETRAPRADIVVRVAGGATGLLALAALTTPWMNNTVWLRLAVGGVAATHGVLLIGAILAWRAGSYHARFFVLSFGLLLAGIVPTAVIWLLAIPLGLSAMSMMLSSALEMLLLSLVIADRFARLQREKLAAQAEAVHEAEKRQALQEVYATELEHEVRQRTRKLADAHADKDRMMAVLGHDLRGPLTALTLSAEQVAGDAGAAAARPGFVGEAAQAGRALLLLLEDVVLWARLRTGTMHTGVHPAENVVGPAVDLHRTLARQRGIMLALEVDPGLRVRVDLVPAQALVRNLVSNAVKFARAGVLVSLAPALGDRVRITVTDDGSGLPPEVAAALEAGVAPGATHGGLGLWLCVEIAQALGTRLELAVPAGGGTGISFTLPQGGDAQS